MEAHLDPEYVLDRMELYLMSFFLDNAWRCNRDSWEQTRVTAFLQAQTNSTRKLKPEKVLPLPWDNNEKKAKKQTRVSEEDDMKLRKEAEILEKKLFNNG